MIGGTITVFAADGTKVKSVTADNATVRLQTNELSTGNYFVEIQKESITMKKQLIIIE